MPLPPYINAGLSVFGLDNALGNFRGAQGNIHTEFGGPNVTRKAKWLNLTAGLAPPVIQIDDTDPRNLLFVDRINPGVAIGVLPKFGGNKHVISDNFGGCEFHILSRGDHSAAAFLHCYRGGGVTSQYVLAGNWWYRNRLNTLGLAPAVFPDSIVAYAYVQHVGAYVASCALLQIDGHGQIVAVHNPIDVAL